MISLFFDKDEYYYDDELDKFEILVDEGYVP